MNEQTYPWYMVNKDGMAALCADQADAEQEAKNAQEVWPHMGPHRAVRLVEASQAFTAADMATASAQGFRDGVASVAASAGSEPVALPSGWVPLTITHEGQYPEEVAYGPQIMMDRLGKWLGKYFAQIAAPTPTQGLQRLHDLLYTAQRTVGEEQRIAITAARVELSSLRSAGVPTGYWDGEFSDVGCALLYEVPQVSAFGHQYRNVPLYTNPSPPEGMVGGWQDIATAPKNGTPLLLRSKKGRVADGLWLAATSSHGGWVWAYVNQEPTHWMPLPPAPSTEGESNE